MLAINMRNNVHTLNSVINFTMSTINNSAKSRSCISCCLLLLHSNKSVSVCKEYIKMGGAVVPKEVRSYYGLDR